MLQVAYFTHPASFHIGTFFANECFLALYTTTADVAGKVKLSLCFN